MFDGPALGVSISLPCRRSDLCPSAVTPAGQFNTQIARRKASPRPRRMHVCRAMSQGVVDAKGEEKVSRGGGAGYGPVPQLRQQRTCCTFHLTGLRSQQATSFQSCHAEHHLPALDGRSSLMRKPVRDTLRLCVQKCLVESC